MPYGLRNQPDDRDIEVVQRILNFHLGPNGWDISAMDDIAGYLEDRGYPVDDVDDPDMPWNSEGLTSEPACTHHCQQHPKGRHGVQR